MSGRYLVARRLPGKNLEFLRIEGPFQYPRWVDSPRSAEVFGGARAAQLQTAFGGETVPFNEEDVGAVMKKLEQVLPPETARSGPQPYPFVLPQDWDKQYMVGIDFAKEEPPTRPDRRPPRSCVGDALSTSMMLYQLYSKRAAEVMAQATKQAEDGFIESATPLELDRAARGGVEIFVNKKRFLRKVSAEQIDKAIDAVLASDTVLTVTRVDPKPEPLPPNAIVITWDEDL